jgi:hypothetical protein
MVLYSVYEVAERAIEHELFQPGKGGFKEAA